MKGINIYRDKILSEYYQFNFNEQPSNKSNNLEKEKDFIKAIEKHISLMKRIHSLFPYPCRLFSSYSSSSAASPTPCAASGAG